MSTRALRFAAAPLAAVALLSATIATASAATGPVPTDYLFDERGATAYASWSSCDEPDEDGLVRCVSTNVNLFDGRQHNRDPEFGHVNAAFAYLCISSYAETIGEEGPVTPPTEESGCIMDPDVVVDDGLDRLVVSDDVELVTWDCIVDPETWETTCEPGASRTVAVDLDFTGTGDVITTDRWQSSGSTTIDGVRCRWSNSGRGTGRDADAELVLDGVSLGQSEYAFIADGRSRMAQRCAG